MGSFILIKFVFLCLEVCLSDNEGERGLVEFSRYKKIFLQKDAPHERRKEGEREDRTERRKTSNTFIATATDTTTTYSNGFVHAFNYVDGIGVTSSSNKRVRTPRHTDPFFHRGR